MKIILILLILIIIVGIYIYIKKKREPKNKTVFTTDDNNKVKNKMDFFNQGKCVIGILVINGVNQELSVQISENKRIYYLGDEAVGIYDPKIMADDMIVFRENTLENELSGEIKDKITEIANDAKQKEKEGKKINDKQVYVIENDFSKREKESFIKTLKVKNKTEKQKEEEKKLNTNEKMKNNVNEKVKNTIRDINIKQEVDMDTMATDMDTIGKRLQESGKITESEKDGKLAFVESDDIKNLKDEKGNSLQGHTSRYEAVVINKNNEVRKLDLENDMQEGTNPIEENYQIKQNKNQDIEKGDVLTRLHIDNEETLGIEKGQYGEVEIYHSHDKTIGGKDIEGNKSLDRQLETQNSKNPIEGIDEETQKLAQKYQDGYRSVETSYQEAKQHENYQEEPCEEIKAEDLDGNVNTVSHSHTDEIVARLIKNNEIADKFTEREIRERVENEWNKKEENISKEEFEKKVEEDIEMDAENMRGERGR